MHNRAKMMKPKLYVVLIQANKMNEAETYFQVWDTNQSFAAIREDEEFNTKVNPSWKFLAKNDTKAMWKGIDYQDVEAKSAVKCKIDEKVARDNFVKIFQSERIALNPAVADVRDSLLTLITFIYRYWMMT